MTFEKPLNHVATLRLDRKFAKLRICLQSPEAAGGEEGVVRDDSDE
jgi:hypothetical protein